MQNCETCGEEIHEDWRKDPKQRKKPLRFCCRSCSNSFSTKEKRGKINEKVSSSLKGRNIGNGRFSSKPKPKSKSSYLDTLSKEYLQVCANNCKSIKGLLEMLGYNASSGGSIYKKIGRIIVKLEIDISHFTGRVWNKGRNRFEDVRIYSKYRTKEEIFCKDSTIKRGHVKELLKREIPYKCSSCDLKDEWNGKPITLELEHINGDSFDNRLENLTFLCPNCHSQTETYKFKNKRNDKIVSREKIIEAIERNENVRQVLLYVGLTPKGANYERVRNIMIEENIDFGRK